MRAAKNVFFSTFQQNPATLSESMQFRQMICMHSHFLQGITKKKKKKKHAAVLNFIELVRINIKCALLPYSLYLYAETILLNKDHHFFGRNIIAIDV